MYSTNNVGPGPLALAGPGRVEPGRGVLSLGVLSLGVLGLGVLGLTLAKNDYRYQYRYREWYQYLYREWYQKILKT